MTKQNPLKPEIKLEILKRIIKAEPVGPMIDALNPHEIIQVHRFVLERAMDFGKAIKGPSFTSSDITRYIKPINYENFETTGSVAGDKNLLAALETTRKQIDIIVKIAHQYAKMG